MSPLVTNLLAVWVLCLLLSMLFKKGTNFLQGTWNVITHPLLVIWKHYGTGIMTLSIGVIIGLYFGASYAASINQFFGR